MSARVAVFLLAWLASAQTFEIASVRPSKSTVGHDGTIFFEPARFAARNAPMKRLLFEAWQTPFSQIVGGPAWIDSAEFDIDAKAGSPAAPDQLRSMLRELLKERFKLAVHHEMRDRRVYALVIAGGGAKLTPTGEGNWRFQGGLDKFAAILSVQLSIPMPDDPTRPSHVTGAPMPVVDKTGIEGDFDIRLDLKPEPGADTFTLWQRALREQLGLRLQPEMGAVDFLIVDHVERAPVEN